MSTGVSAWCSSYWDNNTEGGIDNPNMPGPICKIGKPSIELKAPHPAPDPDKLLVLYFFGLYVDQSLVNVGLRRRHSGRTGCMRIGSAGYWK